MIDQVGFHIVSRLLGDFASDLVKWVCGKHTFTGLI